MPSLTRPRTSATARLPWAACEHCRERSMTDKPQPYGPYSIEDAGANRYNVVRKLPTVVAKELRWEEALALCDALNEENKGR
jgi:hypothetical protein